MPDTLEDLAVQLARIQEAKNHLDEQEKQVKARIRDLTDGPDSYAAGPLTIVVSPNRRFSPALAQQVIPAELLGLCKKTVIDSATAKQVLPPAMYSECMQSVGDDRISLR